MQINTRYNLWDRVTIVDLPGSKCAIEAIGVDSIGISYVVSYFHDGGRRGVNCREHEIMPLEEKKVVGFEP